MQVILLEDVKSLGKKGEIVKVNEGYARNFLLPKKLGLEANNKNLNDLKLKKASEEKKARQKLADAKAFAEELKTKQIVVKLKAGEGGKIFGSISSKEIAVEAKKQCGMEIDKKKIVLAEPIRALGSYTAKVKLHPEVTGELSVKVIEA